MINLPTKWIRTKLGEVAEILAGNPAPQAAEAFKNGKHAFVRVRDMGQLGSTSHLAATRDYISDEAARGMRLFPRGSVLFTKSGASTLLNQRAILAQDSYVVSHIAAAIPNEKASTEWLYYWLSTVDFNLFAHATTLPSLPLSKIRDIPVLLPPPAEQRRIVAEIEKQFTRLEAGVAALRRVQANLKRYRAAVLKAACEGRLTANGREEISKEDNRNGEGLPAGWESAPFSKFIESSFYGPRFGIESYSSEGVPTIRTTDITFDGSITLADAPRIQLSPDEIDKYRLLHGDIVVTRTGATIGKCAIYNESHGPAIPSAYLIRFRFRKELLNPKYILRFLMSPSGQSLLVRGSTAVAQPNVNATTISKFIIPVPPLAEQTRIVAEVERRLSVVEELETVVSANLQRATHLRQSILQKAFAGELL